MAMPDFFVSGAPKAGTTALHAALATHPELYLSPVKEPNRSRSSVATGSNATPSSDRATTTAYPRPTPSPSPIGRRRRYAR